MSDEAEFFVKLKLLITVRIDDPGEYAKTVPRKLRKNEYGKLVRLMVPGDELWEWEWWGPTEPRNSYSLGWCVLRQDAVIASHCHSYS